MTKLKFLQRVIVSLAVTHLTSAWKPIVPTHLQEPRLIEPVDANPIGLTKQIGHHPITSITYHGNLGPSAPEINHNHDVLVKHMIPIHVPDQPSHEYGSTPLASVHSDQCLNYKVAFTQDLYFQYVQYKTMIPKLKEFTVCLWTKFYNHTNDHPVFSYAVDGNAKEILVKISNSERSSYFTMSVAGHTFYRLNYPLRLNKWYHSCQSWNGRTGEWQLWVNAERVGRGFHNRLVGHVTPPGGIAISGQEQQQLGGGFQEGEGAPKGSGGMLGEITMVQFYKVALTAGKAHKDHKHHHVHEFVHEGVPTTTRLPPPPPPTLPPPTTIHPFLLNGQINPSLRAIQQIPQLLVGRQGEGEQGGQEPGQNQDIFGSIGPISFGQTGQNPQNVAIQDDALSYNEDLSSFGSLSHDQNHLGGQPDNFNANLLNPANVKIIDCTKQNCGQPSHHLFKRKSSRRSATRKAKRGLLLGDDGQIYDDGLSGPTSGAEMAAFLNGLAGIGDNQPVIAQQKQRDEREPAEAEVMAVMNLCSGCDEEPFEKALVFDWRSVPKKLFSGAYYLPSVPKCKAF